VNSIIIGKKIAREMKKSLESSKIFEIISIANTTGNGGNIQKNTIALNTFLLILSTMLIYIPEPVDQYINTLNFNKYTRIQLYMLRCDDGCEH
jgi:hypothetical protein